LNKYNHVGLYSDVPIFIANIDADYTGKLIVFDIIVPAVESKKFYAKLETAYGRKISDKFVTIIQ